MDEANVRPGELARAICAPAVQTRNPPRLHANDELPNYLDIVRKSSLFTLSGDPGIVPFLLHGDGYYRCAFDGIPYDNKHAGASYVKHIANALVESLKEKIAFTRLTESWESDTSNPDLPSVAYTVYHDDLVQPSLLATLH